jgi:hypothetical protein
MRKINIIDKAASYCCESANTVSVSEISSIFCGLKKIFTPNKSASYCCESANTIDVSTISNN